MNRFYLPLRILILSIPFIAMTARAPLRVVFFGDSITQQGAENGGYIGLADSLLNDASHGSRFELMGAGIGGNKIYDLYLRMDEDVLAKKPDVVVVYIGINDVWHKSTSGTGTDPDKFLKFYAAIVKKLKNNRIRTILCTPTVIGERTDYSNPQDGDLNFYAESIRTLAQSENIPLIDLHQDFHEYLISNNPNNDDRGVLTTDRVHLNERGNMLVAQKMAETLSNLGK